MAFVEQAEGVGSSSPRWVGIANMLGGLYLAAVVMSYLGLIGLGQWQADEYDDFWRVAQHGWRAVAERLRWSPRPLSELVFFGYGWLVNRSHQPLIVPFLAILWAGFLAAGLITFWQDRQAGKDSASPNLLVALALMACFLTGGHLMEVFYWPAGAAAYLPTLSATLLLFLQVARGRLQARSGRRLCGFCLLIAACSSEAGATFVLAYAVVQAVLLAATALRRRERGSSDSLVVWWLAPAVVSSSVLTWVQLNRFHVQERPAGTVSSAFGRPLPSLVAGVHELAREGLGLTMHSHSWFGLGPRLPAMVILALGAGLCWRRFGPLPKLVSRQVMVVVAALLMASICIVAAAELHFGAVCCARHEALRRCWMVMSAAGIGIVALSGRPLDRTRFRVGILNAAAPVLLSAAVIMGWHIGELVDTYRIYGALRRGTEENFQSGFRPGSSAMEFLLPPDHGLILGAQAEPGTYSASSAGSDYISYVLCYFGKQTAVVRSSKDWLGR